MQGDKNDLVEWLSLADVRIALLGHRPDVSADGWSCLDCLEYLEASQHEEWMPPVVSPEYWRIWREVRGLTYEQWVEHLLERLNSDTDFRRQIERESGIR